MEIDRDAAERAVRDYLRNFGRFENAEIELVTNQVTEGWTITVRPTNSYFRRHRPELSMRLFVDRTNGQVYPVPSSGLKGLVAQLRGQF